MHQRSAFAVALLLAIGPGPALADSTTTRSAILDLIAERDYGAAVALSDQLLDEVASESGRDSLAFADSLSMLAEIYAQGGDYLRASTSMLAAAELYERIEGTDSANLIQTYVSLGKSYAAGGEFALAQSSLDQAQTLSRRRYGVLNPDQLEILGLMSDTALASGDFDQARDYRREAVTIVQRYYGQDSEEYLEAELRHGDWLAALGQFGEAQRTYVTLQQTVRKHFDDDPVIHVRLLQAVARSKRFSVPRLMRRTSFPSMSFPSSSAFDQPWRGGATSAANDRPIELNEALKIIRKMDEPDLALKAAVLRDIGDWNIATLQFDEVEEAYQETWALLERIEGGDVLQREWFSEPMLLREGILLSPLLTSRLNAPEGYVAISFTLDPVGRPTDLRITGSDPPGLIDTAVMFQVATSIYRPRMRDGELLPTSMRLIRRFRYDPERAAGSQAELSESAF